MRLLPVVFLLCLVSVEAFSQDEKPKYTYLDIKEMNQMVVGRDFRDVPSEVRDIHAQGSLLVQVKIDVTGQPAQVIALKNGAGKYDVLREYAKKGVLNWTFRPLLIDGRPVPYRGYLLITFWYGAFLEEEPA